MPAPPSVTVPLHVLGTDVDLHVGANVVAAKGSFGAGSDQLAWRIDAPQLAALGPEYGGDGKKEATGNYIDPAAAYPARGLAQGTNAR